MKMKKENTLILMFSIIIMAFLFSGCSGSAETLEENSVNVKETQQEELQCPKGLEHEPAPGSCPLFRDENKDGYCDFG